jgi:hypothetical protein
MMQKGRTDRVIANGGKWQSPFPKMSLMRV